jgi:hypothetical protein
MLRRGYCLAISLGLVIVLGLAVAGRAQERTPLPQTVLPQDTLSLVRDEISGQRALNLASMLVGAPRVRTAAEFDGLLYEADHLQKYLQRFGFDELRVESLGKGDGSRKWWVAQDGELDLVEPERRKLARLEEDTALVARPSDEVDVTAELIYLDKRDLSRLGEIDVKSKIILTPENASYFAPALEKGALGVITYFDFASPIEYPDQAVHEMNWEKGRGTNNVFAFQISPRQGYELRDQVLQGQHVVVHARTKIVSMPFKLDTVFAMIKGTSPERKGLMFTAHLFERPMKQGANDNISGSVVIAEVARALNTLISEGKVPRPERNIYFLWIEEGSGTMAFFKKYPEMAGKIFGAINMDMVGEQLSASQGTFKVEAPQYSRVTFLNAVTKNVADFVAKTNYGDHANSNEGMSWPIMERRGSRDAFRYIPGPFDGGSDHGVFNDSDSGVSAIGFNIWPDHWYHTDEDTVDKMDPTQMKRAGFIAAASALAVCSGDDALLSRVVRAAYEDSLEFTQRSMVEAANRVSGLKADDSGAEFRSAVGMLKESFRMSRKTLDGLNELTASHERAAAQLGSVIAGMDALLAPYVGEVQEQYEASAKLAGFRPAVSLTSSKEEIDLQQTALSKVQPLALGDRFPYGPLSNLATGGNKDFSLYQALGFKGVIELFLSADGTTPLSEVRSRLELEFHKPVSVKDFSHIVELVTSGDLLKRTPLAAASPAPSKKK